MSADQDLVDAKKALRAKLLRRRRGVSSDVLRRVGASISEAVASEDVFLRATSVAIFATSGGEPDLTPLFEATRRLGKLALYPRCGDEGRLTFHAVDSLDDLVVGRYGLAEPAADRPVVPLEQSGLIVVPAVAIDERGARLGRGAGWYDRSLPKGGGPPVLAAVHGFQEVARVPAGPDDRLVDGWVCESGVRWV